MDRDIVLKEILNLNAHNILCELPTSFGKTRIAIELLKKHKVKTILIVIPRNVLIANWKDEIVKWCPKNKWDITFTTYVSLPKHKGNWDCIVYDECHHLSERCREALCDFTSRRNILLSATVSKDFKDILKEVFGNLYCYKVTAKEAIEHNVLPDPKVILLPLRLKDKEPTEDLWFNRSRTKVVELPYTQIWTARKNKMFKFRVYCTQKQYYKEVSNTIQYYKDMYIRSRREMFRNKWLQECNKRLKWLSDKKVEYIYQILERLGSMRTLTFCGTIEQTVLLGEHCINSKNKESLRILSDFNSGKINHITACNCLNEGMNLVDCQVGIYVNLNSSETIIAQRLGRILRHPNPLIIIPYFVGTREEELKDKMLENYNPELITTITSLDEIK